MTITGASHAGVNARNAQVIIAVVTDAAMVVLVRDASAAVIAVDAECVIDIAVV